MVSGFVCVCFGVRGIVGMGPQGEKRAVLGRDG